MPGAGVGKPLRTQRGFKVTERKTAAWQRFTAARGTWQAAWDPATGVPSRLWGAGVEAPGAIASAAIAEGFARKLLADHLDLLAPGAQLADFRLVTNHFDGDIRSVGFVQELDGRRVVGGQVSFRFKKDRLFVIGSEALPFVRAMSIAQPRAKLAAGALHARAVDNLRRELDLPNAPVSAPSSEVILPLVSDDAVLGYRAAVPMEIDGGVDGRYLSYVDPSTGTTLAVRQMNTYATGTLLYKAVDRHPLRARVDRPAAKANVTVGASPQTTTLAGQVTWTPDVAQPLKTSVLGPLVTIVNKSAAASLVAADLQIAPNGTVVWDASVNAEDDAQVQTFLATNTVKEYVRTFDPAMAKLDEPIEANVNIPQSCNAFFNGTSINFFASSDQCQNTGQLQDVVYHEFGHAVHVAEILEGVGAFDGAMSEGAADFLAASITNDSGMGRGFFKTDEALRELDPVDKEHIWPRDIAEIHYTGIIYGGTFWDLRKALIAKHGAPAGVALVNKLYVQSLRSSVSIPTSMIETLAADDDDGNLDNGTPNECAIRDAYGRHGLRTATGSVIAPGSLDIAAQSTIVRVGMTGLSPRCGGDEIDKVTLEWKPTFTGVPAAGSTIMTLDNGVFTATMPLPVDEMMFYTARVAFKDGSELRLADNLADPYYQLYQGKTVPLYCTNFDERDPSTDGWRESSGDGTTIWQWDVAGQGGGTDPAAAFSGTKILGQRIGGEYPASFYSLMELPEIDVGRYSDVRLQYRRWLAVEDSYYDKARVIVNGQQAWINYSANIGDSSAIHHIDREWRFHDVRVSGYALGSKLKIGFELSTDEGLHLGGWHIDDVCVVANVNSICGDGVRSPTEVCDNGADNSDAPDAECRTYCKPSGCGDLVLDSTEECDVGPNGSDKCTVDCLLIEESGDGGCCSSSSGGAAGAFGLAGFAALLMLRRRRR